eukprot:PhF_6_TR36363/c0_g1_i1/m.53393
MESRIHNGRVYGLFIDGHFVEELHSVAWCNGSYQAVSYKKLLAFITVKLNLPDAHAFDSLMYFNSGQDRFYQDELDELKFQMHIGSTKWVDGKIRQSGVDSDITMHVTEYALKNKSLPTTMVCVWGDMDFTRVVRHCVSKYGCQVHVVSWRGPGRHIVTPNDHVGLLAMAWYDVQTDFPMNVFIHLVNEEYNVFQLQGAQSITQIDLATPPSEASVVWAEGYLRGEGLVVDRQSVMQSLLAVEMGGTVQLSSEGKRAMEILKWHSRTVSPDHTWVVFRSRENLPVNAMMRDIVKTIEESPSRIVLLEGTTGCGKSTQIPPAILDVHPHHYVYCTQPRRIAAKSLARHVRTSQARSDVGYHVGGDSDVTTSTRLTYMTTGVLFRKVLDGFRTGRYLNNDSVTHIFLDEVHERTVEYEFLLALLRELLIHNRKLRLVVMSATIGTAFLQAYLYRGYLHTEQLKESTADSLWTMPTHSAQDLTSPSTTHLETMNRCVPIITIPTKTFERVTYYFEDVLNVVQMIRNNGRLVLPFDENDDEEPEVPSTTSALMSRTTVVEILHSLELPSLSSEYFEKCETNNNAEVVFDSARKRYLKMMIALLHVTRPLNEGILVFLSGLVAIEEVADFLNMVLREDEYMVIRLHAVFVGDEQERLLQPTNGVRKIILSTVVAESSITIAEVDHVLDSCVIKDMVYGVEDHMGYLTER